RRRTNCARTTATAAKARRTTSTRKICTRMTRSRIFRPSRRSWVDKCAPSTRASASGRRRCGTIRWKSTGAAAGAYARKTEAPTAESTSIEDNMAEIDCAEMECERCFGSGIANCESCDGKGRVHHAESTEYKDCDYCRGTGRFKCLDCDGKGSL